METHLLNLRIPLKTWGRLASEADKADCTIEALLIEAIGIILARRAQEAKGGPKPVPGPDETRAEPLPEREPEPIPYEPEHRGGRGRKIVDDERVAAMHGQHLSGREIARRLGVSQESVRRALDRLELSTGRKQKLIDHDDVRRLHAQGLDDTEIGKELGFKRSSIREVRDALGLAPLVAYGMPRPIPHSVVNVIRNMPNEFTQAALARAFDRHPDTLSLWAQQGYGPTRHVDGKRRRYRREEVIDWVLNGQAYTPPVAA